MDTVNVEVGCANCKHGAKSWVEDPCSRCIRGTGSAENWKWVGINDPETTNNPKTRADFLKMVEGIICKDRNSQYGEPEDNFGRIAKFWSDYLETSIDAADVAIMMSLFKIARIATGGNKSDNWIDLIGYAACGAECANRQK